jgi:hypothetical protein
MLASGSLSRQLKQAIREAMKAPGSKRKTDSFPPTEEVLARLGIPTIPEDKLPDGYILLCDPVSVQYEQGTVMSMWQALSSCDVLVTKKNDTIRFWRHASQMRVGVSKSG